MPFVKLDCGIIHSSLWAEDSDTKICWITLLLLADATGFVRAAASAIAREAGISAAAGRRALNLFASPDDESRTPDNQGKRIEKIDGGYRILNYEKYRERDYTNAERQKRHREKLKSNVTSVTKSLPVTASNTCRSRVQKHTKEEEGAKGSRPTSIEDFLKQLETDPTYSGINIRTEYGKMLTWCRLHWKQPTILRFGRWINKAEKPLSDKGWKPGCAKPYGNNYLPPAREPTEAELAKQREIARTEKEKLRLELQK